MRDVLTLITGALLLLCVGLTTGCATTRAMVNCDNAAKVRAAAQASIRAIDRACPIAEQ